MLSVGSECVRPADASGAVVGRASKVWAQLRDCSWMSPAEKGYKKLGRGSGEACMGEAREAREGEVRERLGRGSGDGRGSGSGGF